MFCYRLPLAGIVITLILWVCVLVPANTAANTSGRSIATFSHRPVQPGDLSENVLIESAILGYQLQYRVYLPPEYEHSESLPVLYVTDGQWYVESGEMPGLLDEMIEDGAIRPLIVVFVDNRDPNDLQNNRRNGQFWCNTRYSDFFIEELIPEIDSSYKTSPVRSERTILGLSFGGLNSACFGLHASSFFEGIAMQSPAMRPVPDLLSTYDTLPKKPLNIFLSTGTKRDNTASARRFRDILQDKGYRLHYEEVPFGHNWQNWKPLLDDILLYFYAR